MDSDDKGSTDGVMLSNLPLVFAHGVPATLSNLTLSDLENFVPFMVCCSVAGGARVPWSQLRRPNWWPQKLPFRMPATGSQKHRKEMLIGLVEKCYSFHGCQYLLEFCSILDKQRPPSGHRFNDNRDGTTSMYHGTTGKLLVTFKNENRDYDQWLVDRHSAQPQHKKLLKSPTYSGGDKNGSVYRNHSASRASGGAMVQPAVCDIYLCDKCDQEFTSLREVQTHERTCQGDRPVSPKMDSPYPEIVEDFQEPNEQVPYLAYFRLQPAKDCGKRPNIYFMKNPYFDGSRKFFGSNYFRYDSIALSSPLGKFILKNSKFGSRFQLSEQQVSKYEKYIGDWNNDASLTRERCSNRWIVMFRCTSPNQVWSHVYCFSRKEKQERLKTIESGLDRRSRIALSKCKRVEVRLKRVSKREIDRAVHMGRSPKLCIDLTVDESLHSFRLQDENPQLANASSVQQLPNLASDAASFIGQPGCSFPELPWLSSLSEHSIFKDSLWAFDETPISSVPSCDLNSSPRPTLESDVGLRKFRRCDAKELADPSPSLLGETRCSMDLLQQKQDAPIEVIELSSDEDDLKAGSPNGDLSGAAIEQHPSKLLSSESKNECSHWSSRAQSSLSSGRRSGGLATNGTNSVHVPTPDKCFVPYYDVRTDREQHYSSVSGSLGHRHTSLCDHSRVVYPLNRLDVESPFSGPSELSPTTPEDLLVDQDLAFQEMEGSCGKFHPSGATTVRIAVDNEISFKAPIYVDKQDRCFCSRVTKPSRLCHGFPLCESGRISPDKCRHCGGHAKSPQGSFFHRTPGVHCFSDTMSEGLGLLKALVTSVASLQTRREGIKAEACLDSQDELFPTSPQGPCQQSTPPLSKCSAEASGLASEAPFHLAPTCGQWGCTPLHDSPKTCMWHHCSPPPHPCCRCDCATRRPCPSTERGICATCLVGPHCHSPYKDILQLTARIHKYCHEARFLKDENENGTAAFAPCRCSSLKEANSRAAQTDQELHLEEAPRSGRQFTIFNKAKVDKSSFRGRARMSRPRGGPRQARASSRLSRELASLEQDECKELRKRGFHPSDVLGVVSSEDEEDEGLAPAKVVKQEPVLEAPVVRRDSSGKPKVPHMIRALMRDECKELRRKGFHPSRAVKLVDDGRILRGSRRRGAALQVRGGGYSRLSALKRKWADWPSARSTRAQAREPLYGEVESLRSGHRRLLSRSDGMCVVNYRVPAIT